MYYYVSSSSSLFVQHYILTKTQRQREVYCKLTKHTRRCRRVHFKANYISNYTMHLILFRLKDFGISWHIDIRSILGVNILNLAQIQTSQFRRTSIYQALFFLFATRQTRRWRELNRLSCPRKKSQKVRFCLCFFLFLYFGLLAHFVGKFTKKTKKS